MNDVRLRHIPMLLETPKNEDLAEDIMNLATLRSLVAAPATGGLTDLARQ